jgi:hypothetical protein
MLSYVNIANSGLKHKSAGLGRATTSWTLGLFAGFGKPPARRKHLPPGFAIQRSKLR